MALISIPYFASYDEIIIRIQQGEITRWEPDPSNRYQIKCYANDGDYLVRARIDPETNSILPPIDYIPIIPPIPLINWGKIHRVFDDENLSSIIRDDRSIPTYVDSEIDGKINRSDLEPIFRELDSFSLSEFEYRLRSVPTPTGKEFCLIRTWGTGETRLVYLILNDGVSIIFGTPKIFLIVGNNNSHPFVLSNRFKYFNSDGSTFETFDPTLDLDEIKILIKTKSVEYLFDPIH